MGSAARVLFASIVGEKTHGTARAAVLLALIAAGCSASGTHDADGDGRREAFRVGVELELRVDVDSTGATNGN